PADASSAGNRLACADVLTWVQGGRSSLIPSVTTSSNVPSPFIAGRLIAVEGEHLVVADDTGQVHIQRGAVQDDAFRAGDIVRVDLAPRAVATADARDTFPHAKAVRVLTPYRRDIPFPSPGGEFFRLHGGDNDRVAALRQRGRALIAIRSFFSARDYLEIESPLRVRHPGLEPHLVAASAGSGRYLITSPEYQMKRLLAGGLERIYFLGKSWREEEEGAWHLGEFTMLEWYRAFSDIETLKVETEALVRHVASSLGPDATARLPAGPFAQITVGEACHRHAGVDIAGVVHADELSRRARQAGFDVVEGEGFESILSRILVERVESALADHPAVFLCDYPAPVAALARLRDDDPSVAERFELYLHGVEIGNAFGELTDPDEQRRRFEADQRQREEAGDPAHDIDEHFIEALREGIPPSAGIAVGVDRVVAILTGMEHIGDTVAFRDDEL
ncbi:MAG: EF-P lysine aminoacylase GenX, partial [Deltaproteobacteria bacterium]|nr:EF-P lysine aminoacylase GenX [Deltaproteobacteria bacterium]